jgi:hypothetical protein
MPGIQIWWSNISRGYPDALLVAGQDLTEIAIDISQTTGCDPTIILEYWVFQATLLASR